MGVNFYSGVVLGRAVQAANGVETELSEVIASPSSCFILQSRLQQRNLSLFLIGFVVYKSGI